MTTLKTTLEAAQEGYILIAEDNPVNQIVIEQTLEEGTRPFVIVANGEEAIEAWRTVSPGLILMDISMPVMNGFEAIGIIRREEAGTGLRTPIVVVTAHAMKSDEERVRASGVDGYLTKPISPNALLEKVDTCFHQAVFGRRAG